MSIFDIDRTSNKRSNPTPNTHDKIISPMAHQTASTQYNPSGETDTARVQQIGKTILVNDGTDNISTYGYNPALDKWGLFVTKPGVDVMTNTDLENLIFNSTQNTFKIVSEGTITLPTYSVVSAAGVWMSSSVAIPPNASIAHGQGRVPVVFAFVKATGPGGPALLTMPYTDFGIISGSAYFHTVSLAVDETNILIGEETLTNGSVGTLTHGGLIVEYYILQETSLSA